MGLDICLDTLKSYLVYLSEDDIADFPEEYENQICSYNNLIEIVKKELRAQTFKDVEFNEIKVIKPDDIKDVESLDIRVGAYNEIHHLKRYAAYIQEFYKAPEEPFKARLAVNDPILEKVIEQERQLFPHLMDHSDSDGFYIPVDFPTPLWVSPDEIGKTDGDDFIDMISIGSSLRLKEELLEINKFLELDVDRVVNDFDVYYEVILKDRWYAEKWCWSALYYMAYYSEKYGLSIIFA